MGHRQALASGVVVGGGYRIERVLGSGGFGITYLAKDKSLDSDVAIKEYFPSSLAYREDGATVQSITDNNDVDYEWGLERFLAEAQTMARLRHPNIVRVSRYFKENGTAYMVLGFVEGCDFETWLRELGRAPTQSELDAIVGPLLEALEVVHKADVVHRDIKPENIYIRKSDGAPILLDFGAARQALGQQSRATAAFVSPGYSPSESHQNDPKEQGPWTDIYGLSAALHRAIVGKAPDQVLSRLQDDTYVPLADQLANAQEYRPGFLYAIDHGMRVKRQDRPQTVTDWRTSLFGDVPDQDTVIRQDADTLVRQDADTVKPAPPESAETVVTAPADAPPNKKFQWAIGAAAALIGVTGLYQVYTSFDQPRDNVPATPTEVTVPNTPETAPVPTGAQPAAAPPAVPSAPSPPTQQPDSTSKFDKAALEDAPAAPTPPAPTTEPAAETQVSYRTYRNARFGFEHEYPFSLVTPGPTPTNGAGQSFSNADNSFQVASFAHFNSDGADARSLLQQLRTDNANYANARIAQIDTGELTAIAIHAGRVHSYTAITSCQNQIVNVLELNFTDQPDYDVIAKRLAESFKTGRGADTPTNCEAASPPQTTAATLNPSNDTIYSAAFGSDQSLKRIAVYGWTANGTQNGLWTAETNGPNGSVMIIKCSGGAGAQRNGIIEWRDIPTGNAPISGQQQVRVQIGSYADSAVFEFQSNQTVSSGRLRIAEGQATAGQLLAFLQQVANGQAMTLNIPATGYQETINLHAANQALGPCLGQSVEVPWTDQGEIDGVRGTAVRNSTGGGFFIRCDTASQTRGNAVIGFTGRRSRTDQTIETGTLRASVGTRFVDLEFVITPEPGVLGGYLYHVMSRDGGTAVRDFLALLRRGNSLRLTNAGLGIDERFSLSGSSRALAACTALY